jgi:hypothetical protein
MPRWALVFWRQRGIEIAPSAPGEFPGIAVGSADRKQVFRLASRSLRPFALRSG